MQGIFDANLTQDVISQLHELFAGCSLQEVYCLSIDNIDKTTDARGLVGEFCCVDVSGQVWHVSTVCN